MNAAYLACGGWIASAVGAAATLRLADLMADQARSPRELAEATGTSEAVLGHVMRLLAAVGLFTETADGRYRNAPDAELLREGHPASMRSFCMLAAGDYQRICHELIHSLETGEPAARWAVGGSLYAHLERDPAAAETYDRAMEDLSRPMGVAFAAATDLADVRTVADVGGGRGGLIKGLLRARSSLRGLVVDRPDVCERARAGLGRTDPDLVGRLDYVAGDLFGMRPVGADLYVLKNVLRNWSDEACLRLLRSIGGAMAEDRAARLVVIDTRIDADLPPLYRALDAMVPAIISEPGARLRQPGEIGALLEQAGFTVAHTENLTAQHLLVEARAAARRGA